jgi:hypothetical protein
MLRASVGLVMLVAALLASCTSRDESQRVSMPPRRDCRTKLLATIPFQFIGNHIVADAWLDGVGPLTFIVDTGGVNLITPALQRRLALATIGHEAGHGVGSNAVESGETVVPRTRLGNFSSSEQRYFVYPLEQLYATGGVRMQGIVGNEIFRPQVVRIDYARGRIDLLDSATFTGACSGASIPLTIANNELYVPGSFDGSRGRFRIDTGSGATLDLDTPFVRAHHLLQRFPHHIVAANSGIGGASASVIVRGRNLAIGPMLIPRPVTGLATGNSGNFSSRIVAGNIGNGALARYVMTLNFARKTLYLKPAARVPPGLDDYDRSGLTLRWSDDNLQVDGVVPKSPAWDAGVRTGDLILSIDGAASKTITLPDARAILRVPAGRSVTLVIEHRPRKRSVTFRLRDLL